LFCAASFAAKVRKDVVDMGAPAELFGQGIRMQRAIVPATGAYDKELAAGFGIGG